MIKFKEFIIVESIEPKKPVGKVVERHHGIGVTYDFTTSKGNNVTIEVINKKAHNSGIVDGSRVEFEFSVNGSIDVTDRESVGRDVEIMSGVLYLLLQYVGENDRVQVIEFTGMKDEGDNKSSKGREFSILKDDLVEKYYSLVSELRKEMYQTEEAGEAYYSMKEIRDNIYHNEPVLPFLIDKLDILISNGTIDKEIKASIIKYNELLKIIMTDKGKGNIDSTNRRANVYNMLIHRYVGDKWNIQITQGMHFILTRKPLKV